MPGARALTERTAVLQDKITGRGWLVELRVDPLIPPMSRFSERRWDIVDAPSRISKFKVASEDIYCLLPFSFSDGVLPVPVPTPSPSLKSDVWCDLGFCVLLTRTPFLRPRHAMGAFAVIPFRARCSSISFCLFRYFTPDCLVHL